MTKIVTITAGMAVTMLSFGAKAQTLSYQLLQYQGASTFFTGIHAGLLTGNYVIPGTTYTGGLLYNQTTGTWSAFPTATANGSNYPGAIVSSPYGPGFGSQYGILRAVGSYQTTATSPYDTGYLYDAAAAPGQTLTTLQYPSGASPTLFTIAHSTFGNQVVGNYDTRLATGNAFIYDIKTGTYTTNNKPGAVSTTAYGIWGDKISGGFFEASLPSVEHGYIYDKTTGVFTQYDHPGSVGTHFEGIVGAGRAGEYNLVTNWITADGKTHPAIMHVAADGTVTWYEITIPGTVVSANSAYGDTVVGIVVNGAVYGYIATMPGIYNPIRNDTPLVVSASGVAGITANPGGDDVVNTSSILVSGANSIGIKTDTYGVVNTSGTITANGLASTGVQMNGRFSTLLNSGTITAAPGAFAVSNGVGATGTTVVNNGIINGQVSLTGDVDARFENNGWLGITAAGAGITHQINGVFAQTPTGVLAVRVNGATADALQVSGVARLNGTLAAGFTGPSGLLKQYTVLTASGGATGTFASLSTTGLPALFSTSLSYAPTAVTLNVSSGLSQLPSLSRNQIAVAAGIDTALNTSSTTTVGTLPTGLSGLYNLSAAALPATLSLLSGEAYASEQSVLMGDALYGRQSVLGRLRQGAYGSQSGTLAALSFGGPALAFAGADAPAPVDAAGALAYAVKAPGLPAPAVGPTVWAQGFGVWNDISGTSTSAAVSETLGGMMAGMDGMLGDWRLGFALGYAQSNANVGSLASSIQSDNVTAALYAGTSFGALNLRLGASYTFNQVDGTRTIAVPGLLQTVNGQYDGGTSQLFAEVGYGLALNSIALEPFAGLAYVHLDTNAFTETSAGTLASAGLTSAATNSDVGYTSLGLRAATVVPLANGMALAPHASAAWLYAFGDLSPAAQMAFTSLPSASFSVAGVPLAQNSALLEVGTDLRLTAQSRVGLSYVGQFGDGVSANAFEATFAFTF
ncbi:autotransporter outer membrane beta-barrel domain-containing protein [Azorhizobium doebereinerae]|uniref:autotransporter outer membrane beta-barrel domain-containing protein n=1 Tax=Azorhizobium doebereinerae TaxID=281091 RepID=UPI000423698F|nr:autotransporter outer membrane beta-barrel domain-containing protein [Azorhizobium doebereinerae]